MVAKPAPTAVYRQTICDLITQERARIIVEVGVYAGGLSRMIAALDCVETLYSIDPWPAEFKNFGKEHMDKICESVVRWADTVPKVQVFRTTSIEASRMFQDQSVCFFETDGVHRYEMIRADIEAWLPKVKPGCILAGDNHEYPDVARAVGELLPHRELAANGRVWWARKLA